MSLLAKFDKLSLSPCTSPTLPNEYPRSVKAKAALEDTTSNKRKASSSNGLTDSTKVQPKKVKTNQPAGKKLATPKASLMIPPLPAQSHVSLPATSRHASVTSEEEESALHAGSTIIHVGLDGSETESQAGEDTHNASAEEAEEDAEAELGMIL
jgi:hypothetical protein